MLVFYHGFKIAAASGIEADSSLITTALKKDTTQPERAEDRTVETTGMISF